MPRIPDPEYIAEIVTGALYDLPGGLTLVLGAPPPALAGFAPCHIGELTLRYGIAFQTPPARSIIPGLFVAERGGMLTGREAWDFLLQTFQMHPRADVVGIDSEGAPAQVFLRELDFGAPVRVYVYETLHATKPLGQVRHLIASAGAVPPELLAKYLPAALDLHTLLGPRPEF